MAQSGREIQRRINTVKNTQQITRAMEMIAAAKLRRAQERVENSRPYRYKLAASLGRVFQGAHSIEETLPKLVQPTDKKIGCLVVIGSDRGLSGGYNANIIRQAEEYIKTNPDTYLILIGKRIRDHFRRKGQDFLADFVYLGDYPTLHQAQEISRLIQDFYLHDLFDHVSILYTKFVSSMIHRVTLEQILPLEGQEFEKDAKNGPEAMYLYEPSVFDVLDAMVPLYLDTVIYQSLLEAGASQQGAAMTAMRSATDNAGELLEELNLSFNRIRQGAITTEITEIVGGAEALS